jgi:hypothetical protein
VRRRKNIARITPPPPAIVNGLCSNTWAVAMMRRWVAQDAADAAAERMRSTVYASVRGAVAWHGLPLRLSPRVSLDMEPWRWYATHDAAGGTE